jgi:squalene-hopene/tetraprenyl-beta-curcumene cyclase
MAKNGKKRYHAAVRRAADWLCGMQSHNGGFASFDVDNTRYYLNHIPFADHGALLDPPTADVSARCATFLACLGRQHDHYRRSLDACLTYLRNEQETPGCWFGRWGTNYIYGTWSALVALGENGIPPDDPAVRRAVAWLMQKQRPDGGWGESNDSYAEPEKKDCNTTSTAFQTAWALLGLMAAGQVNSLNVQRGVDYLLRSQQQGGLWEDAEFTAPGFPRVFYLKYHGYDKYFPLWALARYRNLIRNE